MFNKPQLKPHFHVEVVEPSTVYLLSEKEHFVLRGQLYTLLAPLLDGYHTVDEIVLQLKEHASILGIYHALTRLESQGYLTEADDTLPAEVAAFWSLQNVDPRVAVGKLQDTRVAVTAFGAVQTEPFIAALESLNIRVSDAGDLTVVLTDDYLQVGLDEFNREALRQHKPWLLIKPVGSVVWVGPFFVPGQTGCWQCLAQRLRGNREVETAVQQQKGITAPLPTSRSLLSTNFQTCLNLAATEVAKWIVHSASRLDAIQLGWGGECGVGSGEWGVVDANENRYQGKHEQLEGKLIALDLTSLSMQHHVLVKRPQCPVCGDLAEHYKPKPIVLKSQKKQFTADGGHRGFSPEQTLKKYEHHVSPITGVVSALSKFEVGSDLIHVYGAAHQFGDKLDSLDSLRQSLGHKSAGKGKTDSQSRASGLCEALERYSGVFTGDEIRIEGTYAQLESAAIHPNTCMQFSATQYQNRQAWNQQHSGYAWVPEPFDEQREIEWTAVWSLTHQEFKYLPTSYCYYNYLPDEHRFCRADSNGNAAGNTQEEAILQGFMELVERDSVALWWYNRVKRPAVDLDSFDEPYLQALQNYYRTQNRDLWVLDITSDLKIPSFAAFSRRTDRPAEEILLGFGTHFDPKVAILRAATEMNQMLGLTPHPAEVKFADPDQEYWFKEASLENQPYLAPDKNAPGKVYADYPQRWSDDLEQDVLTCVEIAAQHGMETLVLDQTRPDIGMSVVKVIVPGMRHFWARFAPGRLYEVPVKLGWLPAPLTEEQLNPIPMFF